LDPILAELDSCSHLNLVSEFYFENYLKNSGIKILSEPPMEYDGLGSSLVSKYPPVACNFQIGGVHLSGRFIVSSDLETSKVLIGSDLMLKYSISIVANGGEWKVHIGTPPLASVPCLIRNKSEFENQRCQVKFISALENEQELEELLEPGFVFSNAIIEKEEQLNFIKNLSHVSNESKHQLLEALGKIPSLYSGEEYSDKVFPENIYIHDVELIPGAPTELTAKPFRVSGIRLEQ